jgi:GNAT superfamily N-acetyltransferase
MSLLPVILGIAGFCVHFVLQILLRQVYRPRNEDKFIFVFWVGLPVLGLAVGLPFGYFGWVSIQDAFLGYLLFFAIASGWVASYPAIYAASPTLVMSYVLSHESERGRGVSFAMLNEILEVKANSIERIEDAARSSLIEVRDGRVALTPFGKKLDGFFAVYRRILGLNQEGI